MINNFLKRFYWSFWRRYEIAIRFEGFHASILSYCSKSSKFEDNVRIGSFCNLQDVKIGRFSYITGSSQLELCNIGKFCSIGREVRIGGLGIHPKHVSTHPAFFKKSKAHSSFFFIKDYVDFEPVNIGHDVWIGDRAIVFGGITISTGAIIAAGAVVNRSVGPYEIVAGVPAKTIGLRIPHEMIDEFLNSEWWNWSDERLKAFGVLIGGSDFAKFIDRSATITPK